LAGKEPGKTIVVKGEPIVYGLVIPKETPNQKGAIELVKFILDPRGGLEVFKKMGQGIVGPQTITPDEKVPAGIEILLVK